jgi:hypothetical protein
MTHTKSNDNTIIIYSAVNLESFTDEIKEYFKHFYTRLNLKLLEEDYLKQIYKVEEGFAITFSNDCESIIVGVLFQAFCFHKSYTCSYEL